MMNLIVAHDRKNKKNIRKKRERSVVWGGEEVFFSEARHYVGADDDNKDVCSCTVDKTGSSIINLCSLDFRFQTKWY